MALTKIPASLLDTTAGLTVAGDLTVSGTTTTVNSTTLDVADKNITINKGSGDTSSTADGAGITIQDAVNSSTDATMLWDTTDDRFDFSHNLHIGTANQIGSASVPALQIGGTSTYRLGMYTTAEGAIIDNANGDDGIIFHTKTAGESMRITADGDVGIGTTTPKNLSGQNSLTINGSVSRVDFKISDTFRHAIITEAEYLNLSIDPDNNQSSSRFVVQVDNDEKLRLDSSGQLGLGVTPTTRLHMKGTGDMIRLESTNSGAGGAQMDMLHFSPSPADEDMMAAINMGGYYSGTSSAYFGAIRCIATDTGAKHGRLEFYTRDDSSFPHHMQINHHGGIAMGANNPGYEGQILSIKAGTGDNVLYGESTDAKCIVSLRDNSSTQNIGYAAVGNSHVFMKDATEKMQLTADGTLLLGQTSASSSPGILEITGTSNTMGTMRISPGSGKGSEVSHVHYGSTGDIYWRSSSTSGKVILQDTGGVLLVGKSGQAITTGGMIVTQNDYMSYSNTSTDTGDRCVVWNRQSVSTQGDFEEYRVGNSKVGSVSRNSSGNMVYGTHSDYRLKENVNYTWDATTLLKQLKPCKFEWVSSDFDNINQGFLAHEVQDIVPQAVMGSKDAVDSEGEAVHQQLDNSQLVPLLVKTIQELEARIATLEG